MENSLKTFHTLVDSIWNQECEEEDFTGVLQQTAQLKSLLWSADLMQANEELRIQFFEDLQRIEYVAKQVLQPEAIKPLDLETRTYYGYLYAFLCQYSNDLPLIYYGFPFQYPIHISCGKCDNDIHSVLVNPVELNEKNTTTVIPTSYSWEEDGLNDRNEVKEGRYSESDTPEGFGEKDCNEWDFYGNVMRMLDACGEEYLAGIMRYLYGEHTCTKCHHKEPVIESYRRWFYANQPNYDEPKRELVDWIIYRAKEAEKEYDSDFAAFLYRMAVWYEKSRNTPDMEKIYDAILFYYDRNYLVQHELVAQIQYVLRELLKTDYDILKARAYLKVASCCAFDMHNEEKNRFDLAWQACLKAISIYQKLQKLEEQGYWEALHGLCESLIWAGVGDIDLADELVLEYIARMEKENGDIDLIADAYYRLARMWGKGAGDYEKCYVYFDKCVEISMEMFGENSDYVAGLYEELAGYYEDDGNIKKACELRELALEINEEKEPEAESCQKLGELYYHLEMPDKAMTCCKQAEELYEKERKGKLPNCRMAQLHILKGDIFLDKNHRKLAEKEYREAMDICNGLLEISTLDNEVEECQEILSDIKERLENGGK